MVSSTAMGRLADRVGRPRVLWASVAIMLAGAAVTLSDNLAVKIAAVAVYTFGFFGCHSLASSWVGQRATAGKAQASSLYLFFYYVGSGVGGVVGGLFWGAYGWPGVLGMSAACLLLALFLSVRLARLPPATLPTQAAQPQVPTR